MLYRKFELKKYRYFLKSINCLWVLPVLFINAAVPILNFLIYKTNNADMEIDIEKIIYFFLPIFSVWTSVFISEIFYSDKTKDVFFFYSSKKRFKTTLIYFLLFLVDSAAVVLLHFYCIDDYVGFLFKIICVSIFYYGLSMILMRFSKSAAITVMLLLLYDLINTFVDGGHLFLLYENFDKLNFSAFLYDYLPLIISAVILVIAAFNSKEKKENSKKYT